MQEDIYRESFNDEKISLIEEFYGIIVPKDFKYALINGYLDGYSSSLDSNKASFDGLTCKGDRSLYLNEPFSKRTQEAFKQPFTDLLKTGDMIKSEIDTIPKLIPIYSNRYIASNKGTVGNSIISVHQGDDVVFWSNNIFEFLNQDTPEEFKKTYTQVPFWINLCHGNSNENISNTKQHSVREFLVSLFT